MISGSDITLTAHEAEVQVLPGRKTRMWTYGGEFPGPTLRRPSGRLTRLTLRNRLPKGAGRLTLHLHGGHNSEADDGQPGGPSRADVEAGYCTISGRGPTGGRYLVARGEQRRYRYRAMEDGSPERACFQWYHDHRCGNTAENVWRGLAGMAILDDAYERALPLPSGRRDLALMIGDRSFDARNQLKHPYERSGSPPFDGTRGSRILVNGAYLPHHPVQPVRHRIRILNASLLRSYNLALPGNAAFTLIGTESGLLPEPVRLRRFLIGPGERAEIVIDFAEMRGRDVVLSSRPRNPAPRPAGFASQAYDGPLMQFRVASRRAADRSEVPPELRPLPAWTAAVERDAEPDFAWELGVGGFGVRTWTINGRGFDPTRVDYRAPIDTTQVWRLSNPTASAHLMHLHHTDWHVLRRERIRRDGSFSALPLRPGDSLKETFFLDVDESIVVAGRLSDHLGRFIVHCHMLDHEDHGLMAQFAVVRD